jgi:hypothetical protein
MTPQLPQIRRLTAKPPGPMTPQLYPTAIGAIYAFPKILILRRDGCPSDPTNFFTVKRVINNGLGKELLVKFSKATKKTIMI